MVYILMTAHWGLPAPNLVVSVVGGEGRTKLKTWVREVIRQGLVKASQSTGEHTAVAQSFLSVAKVAPPYFCSKQQSWV